MSDNLSTHRFFKHYPEVRSQYFGFVMGLSEVIGWESEYDTNTRLKDEMRLSPRLNQHASGVVLGVTQIINGLYNPVIIIIIQNPALIIT